MFLKNNLYQSILPQRHPDDISPEIADSAVRAPGG
jgi:hypothetical protein